MGRGSPGFRSSIPLLVAACWLLFAPAGDAQAARANEVRTESFQLLNEGVAAYNRAEYLPERTKMMQKWADYLDACRKGAKVLPFKAA